ncbi:MAG TPA: tetratricopeptide repeat protein, partial [Bacteroidia bacterium]|nr:tetratricopeptide repeat protein [Bacteroidia bacterium]
MNRTRIILYILISFLYSGKNFAQSKTDSLLKIIHTRNKDTVMASAINGLSSLYIYTDINAAAKYADSALLLSKELKYAKGIAEALNTKGVISANHNDYKNALTYLNTGYKIFTVLQNKDGQAKILSNIGIVYDLQGEYDLAMDYYSKTLAIN